VDRAVLTHLRVHDRQLIDIRRKNRRMDPNDSTTLQPTAYYGKGLTDIEMDFPNNQPVAPEQPRPYFSPEWMARVKRRPR
jgi:hypothetical protein